MMSIYEFLRGLREDIPAWLHGFREGGALAGEAFF
jgi:hypothetical protein